MPIHVQPKLRVKEQALELAGLIQNTDSVGYTQLQARENAGTLPVPNITGLSPNYFVGTKYTPSFT